MKRTLLILLAVLMMVVFAFAGCKDADEPTSTNAPKKAEEKNDDTKDDAPVEAEETIFMAPALPITNEDITVKIAITAPSKVIDMNTNEVTAYIKDLTGVQIDWDTLPEGDPGKEKINLLLAAQTQLPDAFWTVGGISNEQISLYGENGIFIAIDEYLDDYAPNLLYAFEKDPKVRSQMTINDNIYGFFTKRICTHCMKASRMWINETWMDNLGLDTPTTTDEFYNVLKAFKEMDADGNGDPNDEIPMAALSEAWHTDPMTFLGNAFLPTTEYNQIYAYVENGTIMSGATDDRFKEALTFLKKLYTEELLDEEAFTMIKAQMKALTGSETGNRVGAVPAGAFGPILDTTVPGARDELIALAPLKGPEGVQGTPLWDSNPVYSVLITNAAEYPEAIVRIADLYMTPYFEDDAATDMVLDLQYGPNGWRKAEAGELGLDGEQAYMAWEQDFADTTNVSFSNAWPTWTQIDLKTKMVASASGDFDNEKLLWDAATITYDPYVKDFVIPPVVINLDDAADYAQYQELLKDHIRISIAAFVKGDRDIDTEWDSYLSELESYGMSEYIRITQVAYDAMYK